MRTTCEPHAFQEEPLDGWMVDCAPHASQEGVQALFPSDLYGKSIPSRMLGAWPHGILTLAARVVESGYPSPCRTD